MCSCHYLILQALYEKIRSSALGSKAGRDVSLLRRGSLPRPHGLGESFGEGRRRGDEAAGTLESPALNYYLIRQRPSGSIAASTSRLLMVLNFCIYKTLSLPQLLCLRLRGPLLFLLEHLKLRRDKYHKALPQLLLELGAELVKQSDRHQQAHK